MGILDSFYIMFEADASSLNKGVEAADKKADDLTKSLKQADLAADNIGSSMGNLLATAGGAMAAVFSVGALMSGIQGAADYADHLGKVSDALGVNIEDLSAWSDVVAMSGGSADGFQSTLKNMTANLEDLSAKGTNESLPFFQQLGVNLKDSSGKMRGVLDLLPEMADGFSKMTKAQSSGVGQKLGLDEGTIMLLQQGRREVEAQIAKQKELGVVTKEQAKQSAEWNDALSQMGFQFRGLFSSVGQSVLPAFKAIIDVFTKVVSFFRQHSHFLTGLFIALGAAVMVFLVPPLLAAAAAAFMAMSPFLLIGAVVAVVAGAFALLYDDIMNFIDGNDSMIGDIFAKYPIVKDLVYGIVDAFKTMGAILSEIFGLIGDVFAFGVAKGSQFWDTLNNGIDAFKDKFPFLFELVNGLGNIFEAVFDHIKQLWDDIFGSITSSISAVADYIGLDFSVEGVKNARSQVQAATATPLNNMSSSAISNNRSSENNQTVSIGKIDIQTQATDAEGVSRSIGGHLQDHFKRATSNYDDGVKI